MKSRHTGGLDSKGNEANEAAWEAGRGAVVGAARWGVGTAILGVAGYAMSPVYRGLTFQFKCFIQMSGMIMGGMLEADWRIREYEKRVRIQRKMAIDRATWEKYELDYQEPISMSPTKQQQKSMGD